MLRWPAVADQVVLGPERIGWFLLETARMPSEIEGLSMDEPIASDHQWTTLARYFAGELTTADREAVQRWIEEVPERAEVVAELQRRWELAGDLEFFQKRGDAMWATFREHVRE